MNKITTKDKSITYHSEEYDEAYHSITGAKEEAIKKYAEPTKIAELAKKGSISILDVCFGIGYNSAAAIDAARKANPNCAISIVALEIDIRILNEIPKLENVFEHYGIFQNMIRQNSPLIKDSTTIFVQDNVEVQLLIGNALKTIKLVNGSFDAVFLDPFSPKKCPELWTADFFKEIHKRINKGAILATYSCARSVRDSLKRAGFTVKDGPTIARRGPSTIAIRS